MRMIFKVFLAGIFIACSFSAAGQDTVRLTLDSAINLALTNNRSLINAKYANEKTQKKVWETAAKGLPQMDASVNYNNYLGAEASLRLSESAPPATIKFNPTSNFTFTANQLIFNGNFIVGLQIAKLANQASQLNYKRTELEVKEQVTHAYFVVLVTQRNLCIMDENETNTRLIYEKTNNLAKAGMIEQTDADKLSVMVSSIENAKKATERQVELGYNVLRLLLGLDPKTNLKLETSLDEVSGQNKFETALTSPFDENNNYDFKLVQMQEEINRKQVSLEKSSFLPSIVGFYSYTEKVLKPKFDMTPKNVVGLNLSIPIFSSGARLSRVRQAQIDVKMTETNKSMLSDQLQMQQKQLRYNLNNLLEQYQNQKANVDVAKEIYNKMSLKFEQGVVSSLELTSANGNYLTAESEYTNTLFQLLDAEIALKKLNGNL